VDAAEVLPQAVGWRALACLWGPPRPVVAGSHFGGFSRASPGSRVVLSRRIEATAAGKGPLVGPRAFFARRRLERWERA
jgi:hypothetical protein